MKTRMIVLLLVATLLTLIITACGSDGTSFVYVPFRIEKSTGMAVGYIRVKDIHDNNGIYVDTGNKQIYCDEGSDNIVTLPPGAQWDIGTSPVVELDAEIVCLMGQQTFDEFLSLFDLVQEPVQDQ